ncbi:transposase [Streptomyces cinerochromogenes]|uniref:Transposase n=1 Tax=Streptomyces cinerochromogenes TaxID=66422 RepID=A0ABW7B9J4_9ACTN
MPDREVLCGIPYALHTRIQWEHLPKEFGFGAGRTCWRRLRDRNDAGVCLVIWVVTSRSPEAAPRGTAVSVSEASRAMT